MSIGNLDLARDSLMVLKDANENKNIAPYEYYHLFSERDSFYADMIFSHLKAEGYIDESLTSPSFTGGHSGLYVITPKGISYLKALENRDVKYRKERTKNLLSEIRAWVTLAIALLSLGFSVWNSIQSNVIKNKEYLSFSRIYEDDYYFNGESLLKTVSVILSRSC